MRIYISVGREPTLEVVCLDCRYSVRSVEIIRVPHRYWTVAGDHDIKMVNFFPTAMFLYTK